jgi:hypothetical protein
VHLLSAGGSAREWRRDRARSSATQDLRLAPSCGWGEEAQARAAGLRAGPAAFPGSAYTRKVSRTWADFLSAATRSEHAVQVYSELDELASSVATYLAAGFDAGEPAVVVATAAHRLRFEEALSQRGWDARRIEERGLVAFADAEAVLPEIMEGGRPSPQRFARVVEGLLDRVAERYPTRTTRVFGELVDLLCQRGQPEAAAALEELWNDLARTRRFSLLCGYRLDVFDRDAQVGPLRDVCRLHSHVQPAEDPARLGRAVDLALEEVLGAEEAGKVYLLVGEQIRQERVPVGQLLLLWVSENVPARAGRILAAARANYVNAASSSRA